MQKPLFYVALAIAVLSVFMAIYFLIPGIYHPYIYIHSSGVGLLDPVKHPGVVRSVHRFYAVAAFGMAVVLFAAAFLLHTRKA
jgi:hypothetical protein